MEASALQGFAFASIVVFSLVATILGVRLLLLARRTRALPEFALGLALIMIATLGYPLSIVSLVFADAGLGTRLALYLATAGTVDIGILGTGVFTWRVFRKDSKWAVALVLTGAAIFAVLLVLNSKLMTETSDPVAFVQGARIYSTVYFGVSSFFCGWAAFESLRWWRNLRRRVALSLADPVVANRFLLWALWGLGTTAASLMHGYYTWIGETLHHPIPLTFSAACGIFNAGCLFLAFFAPKGYTAWIRGRSEAA